MNRDPLGTHDTFYTLEKSLRTGIETFNVKTTSFVVTP